MKRFISFLAAMVMILVNIVTFDLGILSSTEVAAADYYTVTIVSTSGTTTHVQLEGRHIPYGSTSGESYWENVAYTSGMTVTYYDGATAKVTFKTSEWDTSSTVSWSGTLTADTTLTFDGTTVTASTGGTGDVTTTTTTKKVTTTTTKKVTTTTTKKVTTTTTKAIDPNAPTISVDAIVVDEGATTATFNVYIEKNPGITALQYQLALPSGYTFSAAEQGAVADNSTFTGSVMFGDLGTNTNSLVFFSMAGTIEGDGIIATYTVDLNGTEAPGTVIPVTITPETMGDADMNDVTFNAIAGSVTIDGEVVATTTKATTTTTKKVTTTTTTSVNIGNDAAVSVESITVDEGATTATFNVYVVNNPGMTALQYQLVLPEGYTFSAAEQGGVADSSSFTGSIMFGDLGTNTNNLVFFSMAGTIEGDGVIATYTVDLNGTEAPGTVIPVDIVPETMGDADMNDVDFAAAGGSITIDGEVVTTTTTTKATTTTTVKIGDDAAVSVESVTVEAGATTATFNVYVVNNPGMTALQYQLVLPEGYTFSAAEQGGVADNSTFTGSIMFGDLGTNTNNLVFFSMAGTIEGDGIIATYTVDLNGTEAPGTVIPVEIVPETMGDADMNDVTFTAAGGTITVEGDVVTTTKATTTTTKKVTTTTTTVKIVDDVAISVESVTVEAGDTTATFNVHILNNPGMTALQYQLVLPEGYTFSAAEQGAVADNSTFTGSIMFGDLGTNTNNLVFFSMAGTIEGDGVIATYTVDLKGTEAPGTVIPVDIVPETMGDADMNDVTFTAAGGTITVEGDVVTTTTTTVAIGDDVAISVESVTVEAGATTATFNVHILNNPGMTALQYQLVLPEGYTFSAAEQGAVADNSTFTGSIMFGDLGSNTNNLVFFSMAGTIEGDGVIATYTVDLKGTETAGTVIPVEIVPETMGDADMNDVTFTAAGGTITVEGDVVTTTKATTTTTKKITTTTTTVAIGDDVAISVESVTVEAGATTATFNVHILNNPGMTALQYQLVLPEGYTFSAAEQGEVADNSTFTGSIMFGDLGMTTNNLVFFSMAGTIEGDGVIATYTVDLKGTETAGTVIPVEIVPETMGDADMNDVTFTATGGTITVEGDVVTTTTKATTTTTTTKATTTTTTTTTLGDAPVISVESVTVEEGATTATFDVYISGNVGMTALQYQLVLPEGYTFSAAEQGAVVDNSTFTGSVMFGDLGLTTNNLVFFSMAGTIDGDGVLATYTVNLKGTEAAGTVIPVEIVPETMGDADMNDVVFTATGGDITVEAGASEETCVDIKCEAGDLGYFFADDETAINAGEFTVTATFSNGTVIDITDDCAAADGATPYSLYWGAFNAGAPTFNFTVDIVYNGDDAAILDYLGNDTTVGGATLMVGQRGDVTLDHEPNNYDAAETLQYLSDYTQYETMIKFGLAAEKPILNATNNEFALFLADCDGVTGLTTSDVSSLQMWEAVSGSYALRAELMGMPATDDILCTLWADVLV